MDTCSRRSEAIDDLKSLRKVNNDDHEWKSSKEAGTIEPVSENNEIVNMIENLRKGC